MKIGTGLRSKIKKKLKGTGKIFRIEAVEIARQTLYRALAIRYSPKTGRRSEENGLKEAARNIFYILKSEKRQPKWAQELGVKSDGKGGLICENWQDPANLGTAEGIVSVPKPDLRDEVPSKGDAPGASPDLHPRGKRKRDRPRSVVPIPPPASACDTTELT